MTRSVPPVENRAQGAELEAGVAMPTLGSRIVSSVPPSPEPLAEARHARGHVAGTTGLTGLTGMAFEDADDHEEEAPIAEPPAELAPVSAPAESAPVESAPVESASVESARAESEPVESARAESEPVESARAESAPLESAHAEDDVSIPPVDLVVEEFFSESYVGRHVEAELDEDVVDAKLARKAAPEVVLRRTRLARYVTWAVAGASALCVAALLRGIAAPSVDGIDTRTALTASRPTPAAKEASPSGSRPAETPAAASPAAAPPDVPRVAETTPAPKPVAEATPPEVASPEPAAPATPPSPDPKEAGAEKAAARRALEGGRLAAAIVAGERSVALDAADGEAWLLLGAAYQEKGQLAEARRCYAACVKQGKRGPIGECSAMLR